ncbi:TIGR03557 family F420-dependent LLM class oxidoreductase [Jatrophihabitans telluris]|uniref:TIGR03557 family F420-dependent LLM class oxidoreductase n=1 Tax=Jatrophihabitans telluris TaxID=2038343 RepID=A0ABY4QX98_9ACTN|nr:TIGR03557 family F420-dependent LLM class oxidoreductase [Jatrophihabitans telluris]UQX87451.1 TIGR03557 family F420-dependent LLM class oxidoreductase [Jatrophihabitans telluris]
MRIGYFLSCEEYDAHQVIEQAKLAEQAGFDCLWISDHFHPWNDEQGNSPFVWSVIGALSQVTSLPIATAVTCPTVRIHPAIVAQAAATAAHLTNGRFVLGVGSGEALNEHITAARWPNADERLAMLEEAVEVMRALWSGEYVNHHGPHYQVENARLFTLPAQPPPVYISGFGPKASALAGRIGDGYVTTKPDQDLIRVFRDNGGEGKPMQAGYKVCWSGDREAAVRTAHALWANESLPGELAQTLPSPAHFAQASQLVTPEMVADSITCGDDVQAHVDAFIPFAEAGFDDIHISQVGAARDSTSAEGFFEFYATKVLPRLREL